MSCATSLSESVIRKAHCRAISTASSRKCSSEMSRVSRSPSTRQAALPGISAIHDLVVEYPARPVFRCVLAHVEARLGRLSEAKRALNDLARDDFSALPFDQEWLYGVSLLAETSARLGDRASVAVLYRLLLPWRALNAVDHPEGFRGSVSHYLGLLAAATGRWGEAMLHFETALEMNARMGARPFLAHTEQDYARMLLERSRPGDTEKARELLARALATYRELGMTSFAEAASALAAE